MLNLKDKEKQILEIIKEKGELATTKIAFLSECNSYYAEKYLESLESLGLIVKRVDKEVTYWNAVN
jgi:predicted transcriptional regulator